MRLWTLHPSHLDQKGLTAVWREALLAKAVLRGRTRGYRSHPQLLRFKEHPEPLAAINSYLAAIHVEAVRRGYSFDADKLRGLRTMIPIPATRGQLEYEWRHLLRKLLVRAPERYSDACNERPRAHPLFRLKPGPVAVWEVMK